MVVKAEVLEELRKRIVGLPGISGVGASASSNDKIIVYVDQRTPEVEALIPTIIAGYKVELQETHGGVVAL